MSQNKDVEMRRNMEKLASLVESINKAVKKAEAFADEHELSFRLEIAYGMGGYYQGRKPAEWTESSKACGYQNGDDEHGWNPSSQSC